MKPIESRCPCGDVILADTEDWTTPLCYDCYPRHLVEAYEAIKKERDELNERIEYLENRAISRRQTFNKELAIREVEIEALKRERDELKGEG